jgi:hypothetical protein
VSKVKFRPAIAAAAGAAVLAVGAAVTVAGTGGAAAGSPGPAPAPAELLSVVAGAPAGTASLPAIQARAQAAITARVNALQAAITAVTADKDLGSDQAVILSHLQADVPALQQLGQKIAADTTPATAKADTEAIYTNYRAFALVLPAARLTRASDRIDNVLVPQLTSVSSRLAARETSSDQATVAPLLTDLNNQLAAAHSAVSGIPGTVEAYTPAQWNSNHALLSSAGAAVKTATNDLKTARSDAQKARAALRAGRAS